MQDGVRIYIDKKAQLSLLGNHFGKYMFVVNNQKSLTLSVFLRLRNVSEVYAMTRFVYCKCILYNY